VSPLIDSVLEFFHSGTLQFIAAICVGYAIGSVPFSYIIAKLFSAGDIRKLGSGNVGATNVLRNTNIVAGTLAMGFDMAKGMVPVLLHKFGHLSLSEEYVVEAGIAAVVGHLHPSWLRFSGGKGVATFMGALVALKPHMGLCVAAGWLVFFHLFRYASVSSIGAMILVVCSSMAFFDLNTSCKLIIVALVIIYKHKQNVLRFLRGEEQAVSFTARGPEAAKDLSDNT
jgi:glycerol-3-phosphate acyltransferase PlsY